MLFINYTIKFCIVLGLLFSQAAPAVGAVVNFDSGAYNYVIGNPALAGNPTGIGGTNNLTVLMNNANASGNVVNITGGTINTGIRGGVHWTNNGAAASAIGNTINIAEAFAGKAELLVLGGFARVEKAAGSTHLGKLALVADNVVNINGGLFDQIFGGQAVSEEGPATADNNMVHFAGGVTSYIYGGQVLLGVIPSAYAGSASGNQVLISGGTVSNSIYGGHVKVGANGNAINNTVTILGNPNLSNAMLFGGAASLGDARSGNTLELRSSDITVKQISNFENLHFYLPDTLVNLDTMLNVTTQAFINNSTVRVGLEGTNSALQIGDTITLINAGSLNGSLANTENLGIQGISKAYSFEIFADYDAGQILATVANIEQAGDGGQIDTQLAALDQNRMADLGLLTLGQDLLETQAVAQFLCLAPQTSGPVSFAVMGGSALRHNSGAQLDLHGFNLAAGLGRNVPLNQCGSGNLLLGAFFEAGRGSYVSHNQSASVSVKGDGQTTYYGGGLLARYDSPALNFLNRSGRLFLEASVRFGRVQTSYHSSDFLTASGLDLNFETFAAYFGAHAGLGYSWDLTEQTSFTLYTKYLWTRQDSDTIMIEGDTVLFQAVDSRRWRIGARLSHNLTLSPYVGAAFEYEFNSRARAAINNQAVDALSIRGGTAIVELGFTFSPLARTGFSLDFGAQAYLGQRRGMGGNLILKWVF